MLVCSISDRFHQSIKEKDVDTAFKSWSLELERLLRVLATQQNHELKNKIAASRGQVLFHEQRLHPKTIRQQASTLNGIPLWKAHCRLNEVLVSAPGTRRDKTISNIQKVSPFISEDKLQDLNDALVSQHALHIIDNAINEEQLKDKQKRIQKWKGGLRKDEKAAFQYIRRKSPAVPVKISSVDGKMTAEHTVRLNRIANVWKDIYSRHKNGEPSFRAFMDKYGEHLKSHSNTLNPITTNDIESALKSTKNSSPGLDQISARDLQLIAAWCPVMIKHLASLYHVIESTHQWPMNLGKGAVAFIPKEPDNMYPTPGDFRPITNLSSVYRLWAAIRHNQLATSWFPHWKHAQSYGGKFSKAADQLAYETCSQIEQAKTQNFYLAGISFDLAKCFDTVPFNLALDVFSARGADVRIVQTLRSFYISHHFFRLEGSYLPSYKPTCGIVQGCPLSMLILTSLVTSWLENLQAHTKVSVPRSYADDMSCVTVDSSKHVVSQEFPKVYRLTQDFTKTAGLTINAKKTFTFGNKDFKNHIPDVPGHCDTFRLVGCSIKLTNAKGFTPLEKQRKEQWQAVVQLVQHIPRSWKDKTDIIQSVMSKLTFGQGMHCLQLSIENARSLRANVIRTLLGTHDYNASPHAIFALLTKPTIDPEYAYHLSAFNLLRRMFVRRDDIDELRIQVENHVATADGPIARVKQILQHPVFGKTLESFLHNRLNLHKWQHDLREAHRAHLFKLLRRDRPQHFAGCNAGINRPATLQYLNMLQIEADYLQTRCDMGVATNPPPSEDPRAKLKVLRLLLSEGLHNPERQHRHREHQGHIQCTCKQGTPDLVHISWYCANFRSIREPILSLLPNSIEQLPTCFRCCGIVPASFEIPHQDVVFKRPWFKFGNPTSMNGTMVQKNSGYSRAGCR